MSEVERLGKVIKTDVLVVGGGVAGLFAGIRAKELVDDVTVVDKGPIGYTSQCYFALGGHQLLLPEDDIGSFIKEVTYYEDRLCEQDLVESIYQETFDRIKDFERIGLEFEKGEDGRYVRGFTRGLEHVRKVRTRPPRGEGGKREIEALVNEGRRLGVRFLSRIFVTDILKSDETTVGAVGFNTRSGDFYIFEAGAVVIATGQCSFKGHYADQAFLTGDGMVMAFKAGAELKNLEFATLWLQPARWTWEAFGNTLQMGVTLLNAKGESFMEKYSPIRKSNTDWCYIARACAIEAREGRGPFYIDPSSMRPQDLEWLKDRVGWMDLHVRKLHEAGIKPYEEKQEVMPVFWVTSGIKADIECRTKVPGLFTGGRVMSVDPGVTMGSWSIGSATVLGYRAGEGAARYAKSRKPLKIDADEVSLLKSDLYAPLGKVGTNPEEVLLEIQKTVFPYDVTILKHKISLEKALRKIESIRDELVPRMGANDVHYLVELREVRNMTLVAELMLRASLMRTESRTTHYREDYPNRDDKNWLKWIIISCQGDKLSLRSEPLPLDRYRFRPTAYYGDDFKIPTFMTCPQ